MRLAWDAGADLAQLRRCLEHGDPQSALADRQCGGQPAETAAGDGDRVRLAGRHSFLHSGCLRTLVVERAGLSP
jgi:hypothetical protein